jgi:hypothetical protein
MSGDRSKQISAARSSLHRQQISSSALTTISTCTVKNPPFKDPLRATRRNPWSPILYYARPEPTSFAARFSRWAPADTQVWPAPRLPLAHWPMASRSDSTCWPGTLPATARASSSAAPFDMSPWRANGSGTKYPSLAKR